MQLRLKIVLLTILPLLLAMSALGTLVVHRADRLAEQQAVLIEDSLYSAKQAELQHYVQLALTAIDPLYRSGRNDAATQEQAKRILSGISYGDDGYFFVYDLAGKNLVHPRKPELVGRNLWDLTDPHGRHVIRSLLNKAQHGGGFQRYEWEKPTTRKMSEKLGYVVLLERWGWMIGTGVYLDDVERAIRASRDKARANVHATLWDIAAVALGAVLLVFAGGLALNVSEYRVADKKLKVLAQRLVNSQEQERARVSRELHDGISQLLVSTKFQFELVQHKLESGGLDVLEALNKGLAGLTEALGEVRRVSHDLRPSALDMLGLSAALGQLASEFEQRTGTKVVVGNRLGDLVLPDLEAVALFRIAQEAFTNIERHASAKSVALELGCVDRTIRLAITDDGCGFDVEGVSRSTTGGIGLHNIRERVEHLGGTLVLSSTSAGTLLEVTLPLRSEESHHAS
ncbi:cache domain-containing protein [Crenobacter cavernae]|uniref:Oxygen sensor histidine kinase NreB n=1 Tax=Crenobacter cavernae TaxID=2290923 RepID=A0A345Y8B2_9NEIS|nr:cache domain-containing protein [Crenobacter cavernae]AXK40164.1 histidine kinase [Crenobacter cavernae]